MNGGHKSTVNARVPYDELCLEALDVALGTTPAYAEWRALDPGPRANIRTRYASLPILTKSDLRAHGAQAFVPGPADLARALDRGLVEMVQTSGSTGDRLSNVWYQSWWDACERASWSLNRHTADACLGSHREAILTSPLCTGFPCEDGYLGMAERRLGRFLYLNERSDPTTWTADHMDRMLSEIEIFGPRVVEANPSFLARLSRHTLARGRRASAAAHVFFTYETPSKIHRRLVRQAFGVAGVSSYGTTEAGTVFVECEEGRHHQNTQFCHVDFLPFRPEHGGPRVGRILVTTFRNPWRALLRFDVGDVVRIADSCPCGRTEGLILEAVEGRVANLTARTDGGAVTQGQVDRSLSPIPDLLEYHLVQTAHTTYEVGFVSADGPATRRRVGQEIEDRLHGLYGEGSRIKAEAAVSIRPDPPGKYRPTRSLTPLDEATLVAHE